MVRVLFEISLPAMSLRKVQDALRPENLGAAVAGRVELSPAAAGCESPARGGEASWTPCWISVEAQDSMGTELTDALRRVKRAVVEACHDGGLEVRAIPANAQIGDEYHRFRDLLDVARHLGSG